MYCEESDGICWFYKNLNYSRLFFAVRNGRRYRKPQGNMPKTTKEARMWELGEKRVRIGRDDQLHNERDEKFFKRAQSETMGEN
jgi:hypothetical protein